MIYVKFLIENLKIAKKIIKKVLFLINWNFTLLLRLQISSALAPKTAMKTII